MRKVLIAGVVALATIGSTAVRADTAESSQSHAVKAEPSMSAGQVSHLKFVLRLNTTQEQLWPAIEGAFREIRDSQEGVAAQGFVQGLKNRAASIGLNALAMRRLASAAYPLIRTLSEEQKQSGLAFVRSAGLSSVAAAF